MVRSPWHRHPAVRTGAQLTLGERAADKMRNGLGSWAFVGIFCFILVVWMLMNSYLIMGAHGHKPLDPYPWILENLALSCIAGLQGAILLISAKRADQISSEVALHTEHNTDDLKTLLEKNTDLTNAVHEMQQQMHDHFLMAEPSGKYEQKPEDVPGFLKGRQS